MTITRERTDIMKFEKSTEKCDIPFGVYHVNHDFIQSLRENEQNIIAPEINDVYCGPVYHAVCDRGVFGFFVPIDVPEYESANVFAALFMEGEYAGVIDFKKMIPVIHERFLTPFTKNEKLVRFCKNATNELETCADATMTAFRGKKIFLL